MESRDLSNQKFTLEKYFQYIKLDNFISAELSLQAVKQIISHHNNYFPYHNTLLYQASKIPISERTVPLLDKDSLFHDMVKNRGGYCFQQIELLYNVLSELGFKIDRYVGKIFLQPCSKMQSNDAEKIKTHELLVIHLNEKRYIIDSGLGNYSLREPVEFKEGEQTIGNDQYRLSKSNDNRWRLDTKTTIKKEWFCLYQFFDESLTYQEVLHYHTDLYLTKDNRPIRDGMYFSGITTPDKRKYVSWLCSSNYGVYSSCKNNGYEKKKVLPSFEEVKDMSKLKFS